MSTDPRASICACKLSIWLCSEAAYATPGRQTAIAASTATNFLFMTVLPKWAIGGWLNYGERRYGEMYKAVAETTGCSEETWRKTNWVSSQYEAVSRIAFLTWTHHLAAASAHHSTARVGLSAT